MNGPTFLAFMDDDKYWGDYLFGDDAEIKLDGDVVNMENFTTSHISENSKVIILGGTVEKSDMTTKSFKSFFAEWQRNQHMRTITVKCSDKEYDNLVGIIELHGGKIV